MRTQSLYDQLFWKPMKIRDAYLENILKKEGSMFEDMFMFSEKTLTTSLSYGNGNVPDSFLDMMGHLGHLAVKYGMEPLTPEQATNRIFDGYERNQKTKFLKRVYDSYVSGQHTIPEVSDYDVLFSLDSYIKSWDTMKDQKNIKDIICKPLSRKELQEEAWNNTLYPNVIIDEKFKNRAASNVASWTIKAMDSLLEKISEDLLSVWDLKGMPVTLYTHSGTEDPKTINNILRSYHDSRLKQYKTPMEELIYILGKKLVHISDLRDDASSNFNVLLTPKYTLSEVASVLEENSDPAKDIGLDNPIGMIQLTFYEQLFLK